MRSITNNKFLPFVFAGPLFFCLHCYRGVILDAILYLLQYISTFDPERFANDPAFMYGNQNSYGLFSPILGIFVETFGVAEGMKILCWLSHLGWAVSAVFLVRAFCKYSRCQYWFIPFVILFIVCTADGMPHTMVHFFKLVESYTCSRAISIVFGFAGFAAILQKRKISSLLLFLVGTIIHPLTAGWGIPMWLLFFYSKFKKTLLVCSALFPFLVFLHIGKMDFYPLDWLQRPLSFAPPKDMIVRNSVWFLFFGYLVPKYFGTSPLVKLSKVVFWVTLIAFYWNLWGGFGEHIFLYQVQTWRAEWIPMVFSFLFCFVLITQLFRKVRKRCFDSVDFSKFLAVVAVLSPISLLIPTIVAVVLVSKKRFCIDKIKYFLCGMAFFVVLGFLVQQYLIWGLEGGFAFLGFDYQYLYRLKNSLLLDQFVFAFICVVLLLRSKKYLCAIPLLLFIVFPQYQLVPLCVVFWLLLKSRARVIFVAVLALTLFDSLFDTRYRETSLFESLPSSICLYGVLTLLCFVVLKIKTLLKNRKAFDVVPPLLLFAVLVGYAYGKWDGRSVVRIEMETKLAPFLKETVFPQEKNRGGILFYVKGLLEADPRLQFLTGAYMCETTHVGELFFEGQYKETMRRENMLFYKEFKGIWNDSPAYIDFASNKMSNRDTLIERTQFLCEKREIENLVTSEAKLPFVKKDSTLYSGSQWLYLYGCSWFEVKK